jgi:hypothetical protein
VKERISAGMCLKMSAPIVIDSFPNFTSRPFVLLTGTAVVIILLIVGSISLLYTVGDQPLPSTLLATAINAKKE